ncbi:hypothetical protein BDR26DRAFT_871334 [Obelidium mucronatum]|nr:hypothetical protein BDR26DRAFT_871334 [Obelidium mucronatum]
MQKVAALVADITAASNSSGSSEPHLRLLFEQLRAEVAAAERVLLSRKDSRSSPKPVSAFDRAAFDPLPRQLRRLDAAADAARQQVDFVAAGQPSAKQNGLEKLRRAFEDCEIAAGKRDALAAKMALATQKDWRRWSPAAAAHAVAHIDAQLFRAVNPENFKATSGAMLAFDAYLANIVVASVLMDSDQATQANTVESVIATAYILFYVYRDLNGMSGLMNGLSDPRLIRLPSLWASISVKSRETLESLKDITGFKGPASSLSPPSEFIGLVSELLQHHYRGPTHTTVIPTPTPFLNELKHLISEYSIEDTFSQSGTPLLSDIGQKAVQELINTIHLCKGTGSPDGVIDVYPKTINNASPFPKRDFYGNPDPGRAAYPWDSPLAVSVWDDLNNLPDPDYLCRHWLLTSGSVEDRVLWKLTFALVPQAETEVGYVPPPSIPSDVDDDEGSKLDDWSEREEDDDDARVKIDSKLIASALIAGAGNAAPVAGITSQTNESGDDELLAALENEQWDGNEEDETTHDDDYDNRKKALEAFFPKLPNGEPK